MNPAEQVDLTLLIARMGFSSLAVLLFVFLACTLSAYVKVATVLGIVRLGLGFDGLPGVLASTGLALVLSFFIMSPTINSSARAMDRELKSRPSVSDTDRAQALSAGMKEWQVFLEKHAGKSERKTFGDIAVRGGMSTDAFPIVAAAFFVSELKAAFSTGLGLFLPLLIVELLIASVLAVLSIETISASLVAFPFKLALFVALDGWATITTNLAASYL